MIVLSWTVGPDWPSNGEIDIIEGVNSQPSNGVTLHTGPGCSISDNGLFTGQMTTTNCDVKAQGQAENAGCQIQAQNSLSYGSGFNANSGGTYAMEWTSEAINVWFFARGSIPSDIGTGSPDPSGWGAAVASFSGGCNIDSSFKNQQLVGIPASFLSLRGLDRTLVQIKVLTHSNLHRSSTRPSAATGPETPGPRTQPVHRRRLRAKPLFRTTLPPSKTPTGPLIPSKCTNPLAPLLLPHAAPLVPRLRLLRRSCRTPHPRSK